MVHGLRPIALLLLLLSLVLSSCNVTEIELVDLPKNTPPQADIYIAGNFNDWNPGDDRYRLTYRPETKSYYVLIGPGKGDIEFKFTRGDWTSVEADSCGYDIENRYIDLEKTSFERVRIENWSDLNPNFCDHVTLCIEEVPENTEDSIFIAGDFNGWNLHDSKVGFVPAGPGPWYIVVPKTQTGTYFKFHRGNWKTGEIDDNGLPRKNRYIEPTDSDTIPVRIDGWWDELAEKHNSLTFVITDIPENTPEGDNIYLSSSQFDWETGREELRFERTELGYLLSIPRVNYRFSYKFNRGNWATVETQADGSDIPNRSYLQGSKDTLFVSIRGWHDLER